WSAAAAGLRGSRSAWRGSPGRVLSGFRARQCARRSMLQDYRFSKLILILSGAPARYRPRMRGDVDTYWPAQERRSTKSRTLRVFEQLRAEILDGRLRPGARLHLTTLSGRFAVSLGAV